MQELFGPIVAMVKYGPQIGPFEVGQIKAHVSHGLGPTGICKRLGRKPGKRTRWNKQTIANAIAKLAENPEWRGEPPERTGRPRKTTPAIDKKIYKEVCRKKEREEKVTVATLKQRIPELRALGDTLVEERLHEAGLRWLRRPS